MNHSHRLALRATRSMRAPIGVHAETEGAAASSPRTSEGPVPSWAPEAAPSAFSPTAHDPQEPQGSPPSRRSFRPVRWADAVETPASEVST
jgi:hypothetical protein